MTRYAKIEGIKVANISSETLIDFIVKSKSNKNKIKIGNLNIHGANLSLKNEDFYTYTKSCSLVFCDGKGIQLGAWILGEPIPEQITYHTFSWELFARAATEGMSIFVLGSKPGVYEKAIERILEKNPTLRINGFHGYFDKNGDENSKIINVINDFKPDIIIVGFGMPLQEKWINENFDKINAKVFMNGGAFLEWISGNQKQCPKIITNIGMEWFYRLIKEPKRLFKRYVIGNPRFVLRMLRKRILG